MTTTPQATAVIAETVIDVPVERAFSVFTQDFDRIKPRDHNLLDVDIEETVFETHVGGNIYDRGVDGTECRWARVLVFEPPHRLIFSWDIGPAMGTRKGPRSHQRGRGPVHRAESRPHKSPAGAPPSRTPRRRLGSRARQRQQ